MVKIRAAGNRLSIASWSLPFRSDDSQKRQTENLSASVDRSQISSSSNSTPHPQDTPPTLTNATNSSNEMVPTISLIELARTITRETEKLENYLKDVGSEMPGFAHDSPLNFPKLPDNINKAREEIIRATKELGDLVTGPTESVRWMAWDASYAPAVKHCCN